MISRNKAETAPRADLFSLTDKFLHCQYTIIITSITVWSYCTPYSEPYFLLRIISYHTIHNRLAWAKARTRKFAFSLNCFRFPSLILVKSQVAGLSTSQDSFIIIVRVTKADWGKPLLTQRLFLNVTCHINSTKVK